MKNEEKKTAEPEHASFATVDQVYNEGLTLLFPGQEQASQKIYKCNSFEVFHQGDRVFIAKDSGTYVVLFPIGGARNQFHADSAATAASANYAATAGTAGTANSAVQSASADKLSTSRKISLAGDVTGSVAFNGSSDVSLSTSANKAGAVKDQAYPSSRTVQFRVANAGKLQFKSSYYNSGSWYNMDGTLG